MINYPVFSVLRVFTSLKNKDFDPLIPNIFSRCYDKCSVRLRSRLSDLPNPSAQAGYDTRSIFKRSLTGLNLGFSFSPRLKNLVCPTIYL